MAVVAAAAATLLGAAPAAAGESDAPSMPQQQIGASVGQPVQVRAEVLLPAWVLPATRDGFVAVEGLDGRDLLRLDATRISAQTASAESAGLQESLPSLSPHEQADAVKVTEAHRAARPAVAPLAVADAATAVLDQAVRPGTAQPVTQNEGSVLSALGPGWVPIESFGLASGSDGLPWASGLAVLVLGTGAAGVVAARRRRPYAG